jgi:hypothetical protein
MSKTNLGIEKPAEMLHYYAKSRPSQEKPLINRQYPSRLYTNKLYGITLPLAVNFPLPEPPVHLSHGETSFQPSQAFNKVHYALT